MIFQLSLNWTTTTVEFSCRDEEAVEAWCDVRAQSWAETKLAEYRARAFGHDELKRLAAEFYRFLCDTFPLRRPIVDAVWGLPSTRVREPQTWSFGR